MELSSCKLWSVKCQCQMSCKCYVWIMCESCMSCLKDDSRRSKGRQRVSVFRSRERHNVFGQHFGHNLFRSPQLYESISGNLDGNLLIFNLQLDRPSSIGAKSGNHKAILVSAYILDFRFFDSFATLIACCPRSRWPSLSVSSASILWARLSSWEVFFMSNAHQIDKMVN